MKRNVLSVDVFIATPGARTEYFAAAIEAIRDVNASASDDLPIVFSSSHWTDLHDWNIPHGKTGQDVIDAELIGGCDLALIIFGEEQGSIGSSGLPKTFDEFLRLCERRSQLGDKKLLLAFREGSQALSTAQRTAQAKIFYQPYATTEGLAGLIREFLRNRREDFRSELFLTMPIQNMPEVDEASYLETNSARLIEEIYPEETPISLRGRHYPYAKLLGSSDDSAFRSNDGPSIEELLSNCLVEHGDFTVKDATDGVRQKLFQAQFILFLIFCRKIRDNKYSTRFYIDPTSNRGMIQRTTFREQAISNLALFWPHTSTPGKWTGKSGLHQDFKFADAPAYIGAKTSFLGGNFKTLHDLIASSERTPRKLPPPHTEHLANTLGVASLVALFIDDEEEPLLLVEERTQNAAVFSKGVHTLASFALTWPNDASGKACFDLWNFIKENTERNIRSVLTRSDIEGVHGITMTITPLLLAREMMRGGKPQLFLLSTLFVDQTTGEKLKAEFTISGYTTPEDVVKHKNVTEEFRFAAALFLASRNSIPGPGE